jgi:hypothetical protein
VAPPTQTFSALAWRVRFGTVAASVSAPDGTVCVLIF